MKAALENWTKLVDLEKLKRDYGSPLWIVSKNQLLENLKKISAFTNRSATAAVSFESSCKNLKGSLILCTNIEQEAEPSESNYCK